MDENYEPKLTDFAPDRIIGEAAFQSSVLSASPRSCYVAPGMHFINLVFSSV